MNACAGYKHWLHNGFHKQQVENSASKLALKTESSPEDESTVAKQGFGGLLSSLVPTLLSVDQLLYSHNFCYTHAFL